MALSLSRKTQDAVRHYREQALIVLTSPYRFFKFMCFSVGFVVIAATMVLALYVYSLYRSTPHVDRMTFAEVKAQATKRINDRLENKRAPHAWVEINAISRDFIYSIVMSEDSTFFENDGFNMDAMRESIAEDIRQNKAAYGASTITQQVAKNLFLSQDKTLSRKLKEIWLTERLAKHFDKNQVLELYLNLAEFGPDIFGASAAAAHYFHKKPVKINAAEGAFLALMLPSPRKNHYAIFENRNLTRARKRHIHRVLSDMLYNELISERQYRAYLKYDFFKAAHGPTRALAGKPHP